MSSSIERKPGPQGVQVSDIADAVPLVSRYAHRTPVVTNSKLNEWAGRSLFFKCENLQRAGAFKFRGAIHALSRLSPSELKAGVVTHSSGNHAGALALAAKIFEIPAYVVMPDGSNAIKQAAVREYGGQIIPCANRQADREATAERVRQETGAILIPPYDHPWIIAGQGTAAWELLDEVPELDYVIAPVGGGGLLSGTALAAQRSPGGPRVIGAEPVGADDAYRSKQAGQFIPQTDPQTIADGLRTSLGEWTWPLISTHVLDIMTVSEEAITGTMRDFWERTKLIIEPSCAVAVAVALNRSVQKLPSSARRVGVIISGGNVDLGQLPWART